MKINKSKLVENLEILIDSLNEDEYVVDTTLVIAKTTDDHGREVEFQLKATTEDYDFIDSEQYLCVEL